MPQFTLNPSPSPDVLLTRYDGNLFPKFRQLFEPLEEPNSPLRHLLHDPKESAVALVLENLSEKAITALRYRWLLANDQAGVRPRRCSSDSYMVDVYRPVAEPGSRHLISPSGSIGETLIDHIIGGGGSIGCGISSGRHSSWLDEAAGITFEVELVLFADGEICGLDQDGYAAELQCRKPAAEFVANQIRLAEGEGRDVTPVLSALKSAPYLRGDHLAYWTQYYAGRYLLRPGEAELRHLENRPALPKFYRRQE